MIITRLKGGLGNQMFQYALGRKMSLINNDVLKLDVSEFDRALSVGNIYRPFSLGRFNIIKDIAAPEEIRALEYPYGSISIMINWFKRKILRQTHTVFEPEILELSGNVFLDGYWQSPKYFEDIRDDLLKEFSLTEPLRGYAIEIAEQMNNCKSVSVHIRRGDYVKNPRVLKEFGICRAGYYKKAVSLLLKEHKNITFFVFSDDIEWVKNNLDLPKTVVYVSHSDLDDATELYLMSLCKHNIIANSSFSWWSAWLNQNPKKLVIAPTPWFDTVKYDPALIPESWIQIAKK